MPHSPDLAACHSVRTCWLECIDGTAVTLGYFLDTLLEVAVVFLLMAER